MKKILAIIIAITALLSASGCGVHEGKNSSQWDKQIGEQQAEERPVWAIEPQRDEFGDISDNAKKIIKATFEGTYTNGKTADGKLICEVYMLTNYDNSKCYVGFNLLEDGERVLQYTDEDEIQLKTKVGEDIIEYSRIQRSLMVPGDLFIGASGYHLWGDTSFDYDGNEFIASLYTNQDIKCIFYVNNAAYSFTVQSANFKEQYDAGDYVIRSLPQELMGKWEYSSGDPTVFSRIVSEGQTFFETEELEIGFPFDKPTAVRVISGIQLVDIPFTMTDVNNELVLNQTVSYRTDLPNHKERITASATISQTLGYVQEIDMEIAEDGNLRITVVYYYGAVDGLSGFGLSTFLAGVEATTATCEFKKVNP